VEPRPTYVRTQFGPKTYISQSNFSPLSLGPYFASLHTINPTRGVGYHMCII